VTTSIHVSLSDVAATLVLVALAVAVSVWQRTDLEGDIGIALVRSFIQLTAVGYLIKLIFDRNDHPGHRAHHRDGRVRRVHSPWPGSGSSPPPRATSSPSAGR